MVKFIDLETVIAIHNDQVKQFGGLLGLRDKALLESALGQVKHTYLYTQNIYEAAAQYCISLAKNHAFIDGNKRTAADCMLTFLIINQIEPRMSSEQLYEWTLQVAQSEIKRLELAKLLQANSIILTKLMK